MSSLSRKHGHKSSHLNLWLYNSSAFESPRTERSGRAVNYHRKFWFGEDNRGFVSAIFFIRFLFCFCFFLSRYGCLFLLGLWYEFIKKFSSKGNVRDRERERKGRENKKKHSEGHTKGRRNGAKLSENGSGFGPRLGRSLFLHLCG